MTNSNKFNLIKLSAQGWEQLFNTEDEVHEKMKLWTCKSCLREFEIEHGHAPKDVYDLLSTSCGAEFMLEEGDEIS